MELKELREQKKLSQIQAANLCAISLRSYKSYENEINKRNTIKYSYLINKLTQYNFIDENHGLLSIKEIEEQSKEIFQKYNIEYCYLFGSYAKNKAKEDSDIDLLIASSLKGIKFYGLVEELRQKLNKKIDALSSDQLKNNFELTKEILMDGIKIYGKH